MEAFGIGFESIHDEWGWADVGKSEEGLDGFLNAEFAEHAEKRKKEEVIFWCGG
jgi:hypothetical protein